MKQKKEEWEVLREKLTRNGVLAKLKKAREEFRRKGTL